MRYMGPCYKLTTTNIGVSGFVTEDEELLGERDSQDTLVSSWDYLLEFSTGAIYTGSFRVKSTNFQEMQHDPSQMFPKKLLNIPQCVLMTQIFF